MLARHTAGMDFTFDAHWNSGLGRHLSTAWLERSRNRACMESLDDHLLNDIGKSREWVREQCAAAGV